MLVGKWPLDFPKPFLLAQSSDWENNSDYKNFAPRWLSLTKNVGEWCNRTFVVGVT